MLRLENLSKRYKTGDLALNYVTLEIQDGQIEAMKGPKFSTKSTQKLRVNRLVDATTGTSNLGASDI